MNTILFPGRHGRLRQRSFTVVDVLATSKQRRFNVLCRLDQFLFSISLNISQWAKSPKKQSV